MSHWSSRLGTIGFVLTVMLGMPDGALADPVVYSNFGAANGGNDYQTGLSWTVGNDLVGNSAIGEVFTVAQTGTLATIAIALQFVSGTNAATISLRADAGGVPGAVLESFSVSNLPVDDGAFHVPTTVTDSVNAVLVSGSDYWIVASTSASNLLSWKFSDDVAGNQASSEDGGSTWGFVDIETQGAFRVTENVLRVSSVPEPSTLALLNVGAGIRAGNWLRRRWRELSSLGRAL